LRTTSSVIVPAAAVLIAFGPVLGLLLFGFGSSGAEGGTQIGLTAAMFALGLPAFSAYYTLLRGYYALEDTRSPTLNAVLLNTVNVVLAYLLVPLVPAHWKIPVLGLAFAAAYWVAVVPLWARLRRRLAGLETHRVVRTFVRVLIATTLATAVAFGIYLAVRVVLGQPAERLWSQAVALALALAAGGALYLGLARLMRVEELRPVLLLVRGRRPA
jgi:putative peptidoglycan lipid II flippase